MTHYHWNLQTAVVMALSPITKVVFAKSWAHALAGWFEAMPPNQSLERLERSYPIGLKSVKHHLILMSKPDLYWSTVPIHSSATFALAPNWIPKQWNPRHSWTVSINLHSRFDSGKCAFGSSWFAPYWFITVLFVFLAGSYGRLQMAAYNWPVCSIWWLETIIKYFDHWSMKEYGRLYR